MQFHMGKTFEQGINYNFPAKVVLALHQFLIDS